MFRLKASRLPVFLALRLFRARIKAPNRVIYKFNYAMTKIRTFNYFAELIENNILSTGHVKQD